jgi:hypothetical protein
MDKDVKAYCQDIANDFVEEYNKQLDICIEQMLREFGFNGDKENSGTFLEENGYQLLFDSEQYEDYSIKIIYLVKDNNAVACFGIKIMYGDNLSYEVSDIFIYGE